MATFIPFRAVRPNAELAKDVAAAPYDIVDREAAAKEESENPYSFLHITRPDANMEIGMSGAGKSSLVRCINLLERGIQDGQK